MAGIDTEIGADEARRARAEVGLPADQPVPCILTLVEREFAMPVVVATLPAAIAGCCWRDGMRAVLWVNGTQAAVRQRFTLGHELGHVRCGHDATVSVDTVATLSGKSTDSREVQANAFAAEFLAPEVGVTAMVAPEPRLSDVVRVASHYGISTIAALYRLNSLGLTHHYDALKLQIERGDHQGLWASLGLRAPRDKLGSLGRDDLPHLSPALQASGLAGLLTGKVSVPDVASIASTPPDRLADALTRIRPSAEPG